MIVTLHKVTTGMNPNCSDQNNEERHVDCLFGKMKRLPFPQTLDSKTTQPFEIIHIDLCRPIPVMRVREKRNTMICPDNWLHGRDISFFAKKCDTAHAFRLFKARAEKFHLKRDYKLIIAQRDRGELIFDDFMHNITIKGIESNLTVHICLRRTPLWRHQIGSLLIM